MGKKGKVEENLLDKMREMSINPSQLPLSPSVPASQSISTSPDPASLSISARPDPASLPITTSTPSPECQFQQENIRKVNAWFQFVKKLPKLPPSLVQKLKSDVYEYLDLKSIDMSQINWFDIDQSDFTEVLNLEPLEQKTGFGYSDSNSAPGTSTSWLKSLTLTSSLLEGRRIVWILVFWMVITILPSREPCSVMRDNVPCCVARV